MFKSAITAAITATVLAGSAFAGGTSGDVQLAHQAQVQPGMYSTAEMLNIIEARKDNDKAALDFYLSSKNRADVSNSGQGADQLAKIAGVAPGVYSNADLIDLIAAQRANDDATVKFILSGKGKGGAEDASVVTPGKAALAASVGVNPADYTLSELIAMQNEAQG